MTIGLLLHTALLLTLTAQSAELARPAAEVSAVVAPVKLTFRLHETSIKAGGHPWYQIRIENIGKRELMITDRALSDPWELMRQSDWELGTFFLHLEAIGPGGKRLKVHYPLIPRHPPEAEADGGPGVSGLLEADTPEARAKVAAWKRQGLSESEVNRRLLEYNVKIRDAEALQRRSSGLLLKPGEAFETKSWFTTRREELKGLPKPQPIGEFARLEMFDFDAPGIYRIRAVYDHRLTREQKARSAKFHLTTEDDAIVRTPWATVEVKP